MTHESQRLRAALRHVRRKQRAVHLTDEVRGWITGGGFGSGAALPSRREVARRFGVSVGTAQRALAKLRRDGFLEADRQGTRVAHRLPHLVRFGLVLPPAIPGQSIFHRAVSDVAALLSEPGELQFPTYTYEGPDNRSDEFHRLAEDMRHHRLAGLILAFPAHRLIGSPLLKYAHIPCVALATEELLPAPPMPKVAFNTERFFERAFGRLAAEGRSRPACLILPESGWVAPPMIMRAAAASGLELPPHRLLPVGISDYWAVRNPIHVLLKLPPAERPDSLLIADDHFVAHAARALTEAGLRIPADLTVITHCNFPRPVPVPFPVVRLGCDCRKLLETCCERIRQQQRHEPTVPYTALPAVFEEELAQGISEPPSHSGWETAQADARKN